jgi:hypothetical protein
VAVSGGDLAILGTVLAAGHDVCTFGFVDALLMTAFENCSLEAMRILVEAGADPCEVYYGAFSTYTPMSITCTASGGYLEIFRLIWEAALVALSLSMLSSPCHRYLSLPKLDHGVTHFQRAMSIPGLWYGIPLQAVSAFGQSSGGVDTPS